MNCFLVYLCIVYCTYVCMVMSHMGLSCINKETYQYFQSILMNDTGEGIGTS